MFARLLAKMARTKKPGDHPRIFGLATGWPRDAYSRGFYDDTITDVPVDESELYETLRGNSQSAR